MSNSSARVLVTYRFSPDEAEAVKTVFENFEELDEFVDLHVPSGTYFFTYMEYDTPFVDAWDELRKVSSSQRKA